MVAKLIRLVQRRTVVGVEDRLEIELFKILTLNEPKKF